MPYPCEIEGYEELDRELDNLRLGDRITSLRILAQAREELVEISGAWIDVNSGIIRLEAHVGITPHHLYRFSQASNYRFFRKKKGPRVYSPSIHSDPLPLP